MKIATTPQAEQFQELMKEPADTPVVMVNLLSFKNEADGGNEGMSGQESYMLYGGKMREFVESPARAGRWTMRVLRGTDTGASSKYRA